MHLDSLGYSAFFRNAFEALGEPSLVPARVLRGEPAPIRVSSARGETLAALTGSLREEPTTIVAGDWVALDEQHRVVRHLLPRQTAFVRRAAGPKSEPQIVAANFDVAFVLMGLDQDFSLHRLERYLTLARASGASAVVLLTKAASTPTCERQVQAAASIARSAPVHAIDVIHGVAADVPARYLGPGITAALLGSSGVGKSTLLNHLLGRDEAPTFSTRIADDKGRHTTTHRELFRLPGGGNVVDTPGMRELALWCDEDALRATFDDVAEWANGCRFRDCRHRGEPGCAVQTAVAAGRLDPERSESYRKLEREMSAESTRRRDWQRRAAERRGSKVAREAMRIKYGRSDRG